MLWFKKENKEVPKQVETTSPEPTPQQKIEALRLTSEKARAITEGINRASVQVFLSQFWPANIEPKIQEAAAQGKFGVRIDIPLSFNASSQMREILTEEVEKLGYKASVDYRYRWGPDEPGKPTHYISIRWGSHFDF